MAAISLQDRLARPGRAGLVRPGRLSILRILALTVLLASLGCRQDPSAPRDKRKSEDQATSTTLELAARGAVKREFTVPVRAEPIVRREVKAYVSTIGSVAPTQSAPVSAESAGRLMFERSWMPDDPVAQGQVIARIDDRDLKAEIEMAQKSLASAQAGQELAQAQLAQARQDFQTTKELVARELQPRRQLDEAMMKIRSATTALEQAQNNVRKAELDLQVVEKKKEQMVLAAPIAGVLCSREVIEKAQGKNLLVNSRDITTLADRMVSPGTIVCGVLDLSKVVIRSDVTSKDIARVRLGAQALARIYLGDENIEAQGQVVEISSVINPDTRAFQVDAVLDNPDGRLRPGMFARIDIVTSSRRDAIAIPRAALQKRNNQDVVFVVDGNGYAATRQVKLGIENPVEIEVVEGLREGDLLIVMGHETLQDHVRVEMINPGQGEAEKASAQSTPAASS